MATITLYPALSPPAVEATAPAPGTGGPVTDVAWHSAGFPVDTGPVDPYGSTVIYTLDPTVTDGTVTLSEIEVSGDAAITAVTAHHQSDPTMADTLFLLDPVEVEELASRSSRCAPVVTSSLMTPSTSPRRPSFASSSTCPRGPPGPSPVAPVDGQESLLDIGDAPDASKMLGGKTCHDCGFDAMFPNGVCDLCRHCGATSGCS